MSIVNTRDIILHHRLKETPLDSIIQHFGNSAFSITYKLYYIRAAYIAFDSASHVSFLDLQRLTRTSGNSTTRIIDEHDFFFLLLSLSNLCAQTANLIKFMKSKSETGTLNEQKALHHLSGTKLFHKKSRFKFFRDKIEHWEEYTDAIVPAGAVYGSVGLWIPYIGAKSTPDSSIEHYNELITLFHKYLNRDEICLPDAPFFDSQFGDGTNEDYIEFIYTNLEKIDGTLRKIPNEIISRLFDYGFPLPTHNFHDLFEDLSQHLLVSF